MGEHAHYVVGAGGFIHGNSELVEKQSVEGVVEERDVRRLTG